MIDFKRDKTEMPAKVLTLEYDLNRSAHIALVQYEDGENAISSRPTGLRSATPSLPGRERTSSRATPADGQHPDRYVHPQHRSFIPAKARSSRVPLVSWRSSWPRRTATRSCACSSGRAAQHPEICVATIGQVGNIDYENVNYGKAGRRRHMGWRPTVRGSVMNPCDHPHGGGEGKSPIGRPGPVTRGQAGAWLQDARPTTVPTSLLSDAATRSKTGWKEAIDLWVEVLKRDRLFSPFCWPGSKR